MQEPHLLFVPDRGPFRPLHHRPALPPFIWTQRAPSSAPARGGLEKVVLVRDRRVCDPAHVVSGAVSQEMDVIPARLTPATGRSGERSLENGPEDE
uniref:Uncharacterized protein n=1 Tax=Knipowitschia caucasica TaxID=637954 RepID=A0AAV2L8J8_KNICA